MTEERMIRVNEQGADLIYKALSSYCGTVGNRFMGNKILWFELEPTPPKDWKGPLCMWNEKEAHPEIVGEPHFTFCDRWDLGVTPYKECKLCPFHKPDEERITKLVKTLGQ